MKNIISHMPAAFMPTEYLGCNDVRAFGKWEITYEGYGG